MNGLKIIKVVLLLLLSLGIESCVFEKVAEVSTGEEPVKVAFATRAFTQSGVTIKTFRIIAFNPAGLPEINKTMADLVISGNNLTLDLRPGMYTFFAIGNESADMTPSLDGAASEEVVDQVRINMIENKDSASLPVAWKKTIYVRQKAAGSDIGQISLNNTDWLDKMEMLTERLASKLEIYVRKESVSDVVTIKAVTPKNMPKFSYITPMSYVGEYYSSPLNTNHKVMDKQTLLLDRIYPEHIPAQPSANTLIELDMEINGEAQKAVLEVGHLDRNKLYRYEVLVKSRGPKIEIENIQVLPWNEINTDDNIHGVQITFSKVEVPYSYNQESKVYFTTKNIPPNNLSLSTLVYDRNDGTVIVGNLYDLFDGSTVYTYSYDRDTRIGRGELTIKRKKPSLDRHRINIDASGLTRSILVDGLGVAGSNIYWDDTRKQLAFDDMPKDGEVASNQNVMGLYFAFGSLIGRDYFLNRIFDSRNENAAITPGVPYAEAMVGPTTLSEITDFNSGTGDICRFMTKRGMTPGKKKWKMPSKEDLDIILSSTRAIVKDASNANLYNSNMSKTQVYKGFSHKELFFPASGFLQKASGALQLNRLIAFASETPHISNKTLFSLLMTDLVYGDDKLEASADKANAYSIRCVVDDTPGVVIPLYKISYDLDNGGSTSEIKGVVQSQYVDAEGYINLSETVLTSSDGRIHNGWIINGNEYELGSFVSNIQSDMVAKPRWSGIR